MEYDAFLKLVQTRRTIRKFKPDPVPEEYLAQLIEAARWAPSGGNTQLWEFVVVRKPELRARIAEIIRDAMGLPLPAPHAKSGPPASYATAPAFILFLADPRVKPVGPPPVRTADENRWRSILTTSMAAAYQHMALAAVCLGLSSAWVSAVMRPEAAPRIKKLLGIPDYMVMFDMMAVGYGDMEPAPKKMREASEMLHFDECTESDFRTEDQIKAFFG